MMGIAFPESDVLSLQSWVLEHKIYFTCNAYKTKGRKKPGTVFQVRKQKYRFSTHFELILDPDNELNYLVSLQRNFIQDTIDNWDVLVYEPEAIDMRILIIFSAFVVDTQEDFKKDQ